MKHYTLFFAALILTFTSCGNSSETPSDNIEQKAPKIKTSTCKKNGRYWSTTRYYYYSNLDKLSETEEQQKDGTTLRTTYEYDENGFLIKKEEFRQERRGSQKKTASYEYQYDNKGNVSIETIRKSGYEPVKKEYSYSKNKLEKIEEFILNQTENKWNKNGETTVHRGENSYITHEYECLENYETYLYSENGNLLMHDFGEYTEGLFSTTEYYSYGFAGNNVLRDKIEVTSGMWTDGAILRDNDDPYLEDYGGRQYNIYTYSYQFYDE